MARKALIYALSDGTLMNISHREEWSFSSEFQKRVRPTHFMRVGLFAVTIGDLDLAICAPDDYRVPLDRGEGNSGIVSTNWPGSKTPSRSSGTLSRAWFDTRSSRNASSTLADNPRPSSHFFTSVILLLLLL
jgi:hypothetical protein